VHTGPVTIEPLAKVFAEVAPDLTLVNIVDDSLLKDVMAVGHVTPKVLQRMCWYFGAAEQLGADAILNACSTVGDASDIAAQTVGIPVVRVDEPMAREAVRIGTQIALMATVPTTVGPSTRLIERCAAKAGKDVTVKARLCSDAFQLLLAGDKAGHDNVLLSQIRDAAREADVVVLAQVSMARLLDSLGDDVGAPVLASPVLGAKEAARVVGQ
jgi:Asp/Glu/hydantoin racemase